MVVFTDWLPSNTNALEPRELPTEYSGTTEAIPCTDESLFVICEVFVSWNVYSNKVSVLKFFTFDELNSKISVSNNGLSTTITSDNSPVKFSPITIGWSLFEMVPLKSTNLPILLPFI